MPAHQVDLRDPQIGVVIVDHGSRRAESNALLDEVVAMFRTVSGQPNVRAAHMELAEPTIEAAFASCVAAGARRVVVFPYFLGPGRHWSEDIPRLAAAAAMQHPSVEYLVTAPLGLHRLIGQVIAERITSCLSAVDGSAASCDLCDDQPRCGPSQT